MICPVIEETLGGDCLCLVRNGQPVLTCILKRRLSSQNTGVSQDSMDSLERLFLRVQEGNFKTMHSRSGLESI